MDFFINSLTKIIKTKIKSPSQQEQEKNWQTYYLENEEELITTPDSNFIAIFTKQISSKILGKKILELGCGSGADALWLAKKNWNLSVIDFAKSAVQRIKIIKKKKNLNISAFHGDATSLHCYQKINKNSFHFVYTCYLHLKTKQKKQYIKNAYLMLIPKGLFLYLGIYDKNNSERFCDENTIASCFDKNWKILWQHRAKGKVYINKKEKLSAQIVSLIAQKN